MTTIYTVGHSNHSIDTLLGLLTEHNITMLIDVRSAPYSRFTPQFNREALETTLRNSGISYLFFGEQLGARPDDPLCYGEGVVDFQLLGSRASFKSGLDLVRKEAEKAKLSLLCAEKDPILCHRMILVCRHLRSPTTVIKHILEDAELEDNRDSETRLLGYLRMPPDDLFRSPAQIIEEAYDIQGRRIAYEENEGSRHDYTRKAEGG